MTVRDLLYYLEDSLIELWLFFVDGAWKLTNFDFLNMTVQEFFFTILVIWASYKHSNEEKNSNKLIINKHNSRVDEVRNYLKINEEDKLVDIYRIYYPSMSDEEILYSIKNEYRFKKGKLPLYFEYFIGITFFYWGAWLVVVINGAF